MLDAIVISDLHLGSENCQAESLTDFLEQIHHGEIATQRLILNGDLFDSIDFRRLKKHHWKVLSTLRKMSDHIEVVWINGNHDGPSDIVSHLLGVSVSDEFTIESGSKRILFLHGHRFDDFIDAYPWTTWIADRIYQLLQRIDKTHTFAKMAKKSSKTFLRCAEKIEREAMDYAQTLDCDAVCCGHTHHAVANTSTEVQYFNSGCWTEKPCHYLSIDAGRIELHEYHPEPGVILTPLVEPQLAIAGV